MAKDDALRAVLGEIAEHSGGILSFEATSAAQCTQEIGIQISRSSNPIYVFTLRTAGVEDKKFVAFTLTLDGSGRPATRAEALGRSLAAADGQLFGFNPLLLVYDYVGQRLLAVSALELFSAFAEKAASTPIPYAQSASFSLSPSFQNSTISMYAEVRPPAVWAASAKQGQLSETALVSFLNRVADATSTNAAEIPRVVEAIKARITAVADIPVGTISAAPTVSDSALADYVSSSAEDDAVQVDDRLWKMLLAAVSSSPATILVGPPGTGKSALVKKAIACLSDGKTSGGEAGVKPPLWATPDESWTVRELVGGDTIAGGDIVFRPGWVLRAISEGRWLVLDEANRGDLDRIFGGLLTWLSGGHVAVGIASTAEDAKVIELGWTKGTSRIEEVQGIAGERRGAIRYLAGEDWKMLGTYNALDSQRIFRLGAALGRRFMRVPIPPLTPALFRTVMVARQSKIPSALRERVISLYAAHYDTEATRLGPALFLGMSAYMRTALQQRGIRTDAKPEADMEIGKPILIASTAAEGGDAITAATGSGDESIPIEVLGEVLAEAYVLNVGTHLAQLEEPDFELLMQRARNSLALTGSEAEWVSGMMKALA